MQNASNSSAKNSAKCVKFICKKHCELRRIYVQKSHCEMRLFSANFAVFLAYTLGAFFSVFCRKIGRTLYGNFVYFSSFFVMIFMELCAGMGNVGSRSNPGVNLAIPIGIALKIFVSAARSQRKARLRFEGGNPTAFFYIFQAFSC